MCTYKSTCIANFVAKLAYIHVACNTYIPKVYINVLAHMHRLRIALARMHRLEPKFLRFEIRESEFMNFPSLVKFNSVIRSHESKVRKENAGIQRQER